MEKAIRIMIGITVFAIVFVRITYCCVFHADEVFGRKPLKGVE